MGEVEEVIEEDLITHGRDAGENPEGVSKDSRRCWERRGCEGITGLKGPLSEECPHGRTDCYSPCTLECQFAQCHRPTHKVATDFGLLLDTTVDRSATIKEGCRVCEFFLKNGPRFGEVEHRERPDTLTRNTDSNATLQIF